MHVLHVALEYTVGVGGLKSVTTGLLSALNQKSELQISIVTPYYDVYDTIYQNIELLSTIRHLYKGVMHTSCVYRVCAEDSAGQYLYHYLIRPIATSGVKRIFVIGEQKNLYLPFTYSDPRNRLEYFNTAVASLVRLPDAKIPLFDIVHVHTWHTSLSACLIKEFKNLRNYQNLIDDAAKQLKPIPHIVFTIHMLLERENGLMLDMQAIGALLLSVGLPANFALTFLSAKEHIRENHFKLHAIGLLYADHVSIVSKSVINEITAGKAHGLFDVLSKLIQDQRLTGITNGIPYARWDPTQAKNLHAYCLDLTNITAGKQKIKNYLADSHPQLDPDKKWFLFVGRFANEKGIDMLASAHEAINDAECNFIIMGLHVTANLTNDVHLQIESLKSKTGVLVIDTVLEQASIGKYVRAACDFTIIPSNNETCGLVPMEALAVSSIPIAANIQGLPDSVIPLQNNFSTGTGFLFDYTEDLRHQNLKQAIAQAINLHNEWRTSNCLDMLLSRLVLGAKNLDWNAEASAEYAKLYSMILTRQVLTYDMIRTVPTAMLTHYNMQPLLSQLLPPKIFQIGFNKCGTQSLHNLFWSNNVRGVHYDHGDLATSILANWQSGRPLLSDHYVQYPAFFDMENIYVNPPIFIAELLFKQLDQQYPGSKFILNTRDKAGWLKSRTLHVDENNQKKYIEVLCEQYQMNREDLIARWSADWDEHHRSVLDFFKDRPKDLLVYKIDVDQPAKIVEFFLGLYTLNNVVLNHLNKTPVAAKVSVDYSV